MPSSERDLLFRAAKARARISVSAPRESLKVRASLLRSTIGRGQNTISQPTTTASWMFPPLCGEQESKIGPEFRRNGGWSKLMKDATVNMSTSNSNGKCSRRARGPTGGRERLDGNVVRTIYPEKYCRCSRPRSFFYFAPGNSVTQIHSNQAFSRPYEPAPVSPASE